MIWILSAALAAVVLIVLCVAVRVSVECDVGLPILIAALIFIALLFSVHAALAL